MWLRVFPTLFGACLACHGFAAAAQEEILGPPEALQYPVLAAETAPRAITGPFLRKAIEDAADLGLCEALMREAGHQFPDGFGPQQCTAPFAQRVRTRDGLVKWRSENSRPLKCGSGCFGQPFMTATRHVDRPNLREAMLFGHLDFLIDPPGPVNRDLTYSYEVHVQCKADNGLRAGNIEVRVEVGDPVLGPPGTLESTLDFFLLPAQISRRIENFIRSKLQSVPNTTIGGESCRSIGASRAANPLFDSMPFDLATSGGVGLRPELGDIAGVRAERARVEFLSITRHPLPPLVAPEHAHPGDPAAGYFNVYLNGANVAFPPPLGMPDGLVLPPAGGTVALNYCRTIPLDGADRLQLLFVNALGGSVWAQFARSATFGAGGPRGFTTGRSIVVPATGTPPKPQSVILREFELRYRIVHLPAPVITAGSGGRPGRVVDHPLGDLPVLVSDESPATPCREI